MINEEILERLGENFMEDCYQDEGEADRVYQAQYSNTGMWMGRSIEKDGVCIAACRERQD